MTGPSSTDRDGQEASVWIIEAGAAVDADAVRGLIRDLVGMTRDRGTGRSWAVIGELDAVDGPDGPPTENDRALAHDRVGRLAVRLAVDTVVSVGVSRSVHALHQGAVMEGSWGEEALLVEDVAAAVELLDEQVDHGDVVLVAGGRAGDLSVVRDSLLDSDRWTAAVVAVRQR